jgi:hypothetical protein
MKQAPRIFAFLLAIVVVSSLWAGRILLSPIPQIHVEEDWEYGRQRSEQEKYIIYSAIIAGFYVPRGANVLVINNQTGIDALEEIRDETAELKDHLRTMTDPDAVDDFYSRNNQPESVANQLALPLEYKLISSEELRHYSQDEGGSWGAFSKKYPKSSGLIAVSRVGLSRNGERALVYVERYCGPLCGTGKYFSLQKRDGSWRVLQEYMRWIS